MGFWPSPYTCLGITGINSGANACIRAGCGFFSLNTAVNGSGVSTVSTASNMAIPNGWFALTFASGKRHVLRGDGFAIVERRAFNQVKRVAQSVVGNRPALRQIRMRFELVVDADQARENFGAGDSRGAAGLDAGFRWRTPAPPPTVKVPPISGVSAAPLVANTAAARPAATTLTIASDCACFSLTHCVATADSGAGACFMPEPRLVRSRGWFRSIRNTLALFHRCGRYRR